MGYKGPILVWEDASQWELPPVSTVIWGRGGRCWKGWGKHLSLLPGCMHP